MKYRSQIVTAASGSVGGCVYSRNRSGSYIRNRSLPVNTNTTQQAVVRSALTTLVVRWTSILTVAQRSGWETWAANTPQTDAIGQTYNMTGQNAFISMNTLRIQVGLSVIDVAPAIFAGASLTPSGMASATAATSILSVTFNNLDVWATAVGGALLVYAARPQNPSKLFFAGPYRFMGRINGAAVAPTSPQPITDTFAFAAGQRIHVKFRAVNANAQISGPVKSSILAV
jgi:hypothetical protein